MDIASVQFDIVWEDKAANHRQMEALMDAAGISPGGFVLLPELGDTGFSFNLDTIVDDASRTWAALQAQQRQTWIQVGDAALGEDGLGRNCATVMAPSGDAMGTFEKIHPFSFGREVDFFAGGDHLSLFRVGAGDDRFLVCPLICYDLRFPELWRLAAVAGAEVFTIGASWPAARQEHWRTLLIARAIENQAYVVACNRCGSDPHLAYAGGSMIIAPDGTILAEADDKPTVLTATLDRTRLDSWRATFPALNDIHRRMLGSMDVRIHE